MKIDKFKNEVTTLKNFFEVYCYGKKHDNIQIHTKIINFQNNELNYKFELCDECHTLLTYSLDKLQNCQHDDKPKCRTCPTPCYEPMQWKKVAKVMRYAAIHQGLKKIKKFFIRG